MICLASGLLRYALVFMQEPVDEDALPQEWREEAQTFDGPIYTILVPLFREAHMLPGLADHLRALEWPHDRLDIKIILEEVDDETIAAAQALELEEMFEIIIVPDYQPRTKAKACNYALASARGEFVTIYDAEDQPRPDQLRRAWHIFREAPRELACLQAILVFTNSDKSWLAKQFTIEYMLQFMFFLPFIVKKRLPVFLGGSSNHFRADVLRELHGWDAYNVTEDAEIGLRLARCGYHCGMLPSLTYEEAAAHWDNWLHQRSRWIKGWLQTWLVAMRSPGLLLREIGLRDFIFSAIIGSGLYFGFVCSSDCFVVFAGGAIFYPRSGWHGFLVCSSDLCSDWPDGAICLPPCADDFGPRVQPSVLADAVLLAVDGVCGLSGDFLSFQRPVSLG